MQIFSHSFNLVKSRSLKGSSTEHNSFTGLGCPQARNVSTLTSVIPVAPHPQVRDQEISTKEMTRCVDVSPAARERHPHNAGNFIARNLPSVANTKCLSENRKPKFGRRDAVASRLPNLGFRISAKFCNMGGGGGVPHPAYLTDVKNAVQRLALR